MPVHAYLFEAKSIQTYILSSGRLAEMVGASEIVEALCAPQGLLDSVLGVLGTDEEIRFSRRAGGAFYAFSESREAVRGLRALWLLSVQQFAPGLEFVDALVGGDRNCPDALSAHERGQRELIAAHSRQARTLPLAGPFVALNRRTGLPAVTRRSRTGSGELADVVGSRCRQYARFGALAIKFAPRDIANPEHWPINLNPDEARADTESAPAFPFLKDGHGTTLNRHIAVVHADGNGLGQLLMRLRDALRAAPGRYEQVFLALSEAIAEANQAAAAAATASVLQARRDGGSGIFPARPIVCGGDDLTIIVRADLALSFTRTFLSAFARESEKLLQQFTQRYGVGGLPARLSACAGIAYASSNQPFYMMHSMAEGLCLHAKSHAKRIAGAEVPSALAFYRINASMADQFGDVLEQELTTVHSGVAYRQTLEAYGLEADGLSRLDDLIELQKLLQRAEMSGGAARRLIGLMAHDLAQAKTEYRRWRELMEKNRPRQLNQFDDLLFKLCRVEVDGDLPYAAQTTHGLRVSPLGDAVTLMSVGSTTDA